MTETSHTGNTDVVGLVQELSGFVQQAVSQDGGRLQAAKAVELYQRRVTVAAGDELSEVVTLLRRVPRRNRGRRGAVTDVRPARRLRRLSP